MMVIGRALMAKPKLLLLDEPSLGIAPKLVQDIARRHRGDQPDEGRVLLAGTEQPDGAVDLEPRLRQRSTGRRAVRC